MTQREFHKDLNVSLSLPDGTRPEFYPTLEEVEFAYICSILKLTTLQKAAYTLGVSPGKIHRILKNKNMSMKNFEKDYL